MIPHLSFLITEAAPALANHLWQSTAFAAAIWLLTLLLRNNHARIRYTLWLAASIKFLLPFSLLITLGTLLPRPQQIAPPSTIYSAIDTASQPFTQLDTPIAPAIPTPTLKARLTAQLPIALAILWLCGTLAVLLIWITRWRHVRATLKNSTPITAGREHEILRRLQSQSAKQITQITLVRSPELMEPGIFGILHPTLLWPHRLSDHLEDHHIEAILAHETIHVRRRDNLTAALHMLVEAIFWFHPIVWWMERHMIEERERACDEAVVQQGGNPETYAESLLKACRFCLESPLPCIAGITGADLTRRVRSIMTLQLVKLGTGKKLLLATLGIAVLAGPVAFGIVRLHTDSAQIVQSTSPLPRFDVAVVRPSDPNNHGGRMESLPGNFVIENQPLYGIMQYAYNVSADAQIEGQDWERMKNEHYDIHAKASEAEVAGLQKLPIEQRYIQIRLMLQALLAERFKMKMSVQTRQLPVYALVVAKGGPKLRQANCPPGSQAQYQNSRLSCGGVSLTDQKDQGGLNGKAATIHDMIAMIAHIPEMGGRTILDETGLTGIYDWTMHWTPATAATTEDSGPSVFTALQEQLGLKLVSTKGPVQVLVIDHIEQPSEEAGGEAPPTHSDNEPQATSLLTAQARSASEAAKASNATPTADYRFVVIAIHPTPDGRLNHMPAPSPPGHFRSETISVAALAMKAFGLQHPYQLEYPEWTDNTYFSINATMPEGATQKDLPIMIRHLLEDRFGLVFHTKTKLMSGFEMIKVKSGPDITPSTGPVSSENRGHPLEVKDGVPVFNKDTQFSQFLTRSMEIFHGRDKSIDSLVQNISSTLQAPVADSTGLTGKYDYTLTFTPQLPANESDPAPKYPFLYEALEQQLGIKLQPKKNVPVTVYVIDKALKTPSEN